MPLSPPRDRQSFGTAPAEQPPRLLTAGRQTTSGSRRGESPCPRRLALGAQNAPGRSLCKPTAPATTNRPGRRDKGLCGRSEERSEHEVPVRLSGLRNRERSAGATQNCGARHRGAQAEGPAAERALDSHIGIRQITGDARRDQLRERHGRTDQLSSTANEDGHKRWRQLSA